MLQVVYFASIREQLGVGNEALALPAGVSTAAELIEHLITERGEPFATALRAPNLLVAVNQEMVDASQAIKDGDEVAFFPPVTGG